MDRVAETTDAMEGGETTSLGDEELTLALERALADERPLLVLIESEDGLVGPVVEQIADDVGPVVRAAGAEATRGKVGYVADSMNLDDVHGGVVVIENAQWVDPTSMGRVQRLLTDDHSNLIVIVGHMPVEPEGSWWIDRLATVAERHGRLVTTERRRRVIDSVEAPTDDKERDLVLASKLISGPIPVPVVAHLLDLSEPDALELAEELVQRDFLTETRSGFQTSEAGRAVAVGEARLGYVAGRLAAAFERSGEDPAVIGSLLMAAGEEGRAYPLLRDAAMAANAKAAVGEAYHLAESALAANEVASVGASDEIGELHLICGRHLRDAGRSEAAAGHLDAAITSLEGPDRIDALGFAAAVADDRQLPQEAERILALAEWEAVRQKQLAKLGSLGTFHARALNRIGFADEADAMLEKAEALLARHATPTQQFYAEVNRAWMNFDRGQMAQAESEFTHLRDLTDQNDISGLADKEAWRARALFASGHPRDGVDAVVRARELASEADVEAPLFLADLALAEGNLLFARPAEALEASDRVLDLVERLLPAWENVARANRALTLLRLDRPSEAASEIEAAIDNTPPGADGWRWRSRCKAIQLEIAPTLGKPFPQREAEDLADLFLQSEYHGWAAELLCVIAEQTKGQEAAREAMALANQLGIPMLAARAARAGKLWDDPAAAPTIRALHAIEGRLPDGWVEEWTQIPAVAEGLAAPVPAEDETGAENTRIIQEALQRAGLASPEAILSPAQRRGQGLVHHRRRRRSPLALVAAAMGVVVLAVGTSFAVTQLTQPDPPAVTVGATASPAPTDPPPPLSLEETQIEVPVELLFGTALDRGDPGRSGYLDVAGPRTVDGHYWIFQAADAITATPLAYGNNLLVGSADGTYQAVNLTSGSGSWSLATEDQIDASGALSSGSSQAGQPAAPAVGEGGGSDAGGTVVVVGDDGVVRARDALTVTATQMWSTPLGARIKSSPIVDNGVVYVATVDGFVYALDLANGEEIWRYPQREEGAEPLGRITADLAFADGILYVGAEDGGLHLLNTDGSLLCESALDAPIVVNPVVVDGRAYISYGQVIRIIEAGTCVGPVIGTGTVQFLSETVVDVAPAVVGNLMYIPNADFLNAVDRLAVEEGAATPGEVHHWSEGKVNAEGKIASPPVVTNDTVYFGTESGWVYAVDSDTGDLLWEWQTGNYVRASPVVIDGAVYIASGDGNVYAVGPSG